MNWIPLTDLSQINEIMEESSINPVIIFKHSTRCSISGTALSRFERQWTGSVKTYYLDLIAFRPISAEIANRFEVEHQSPQILLIENGQCTYSASHWEISADEIKNQLTES